MISELRKKFNSEFTQEKYESFLNDMNTQGNILEYIAISIIKLVFNIDLHDLESFFENINPARVVVKAI